jgi:YegS/Rv2252/BmrU family lipid kinase
MSKQKVCLIINPRDGQNFSKLTAILAIFAAAGWRTDIVIREYGGHVIELAANADRQEYDQVIAYGGDGTLNQVVNGLMNGKKRKSIVGTLPGGTVNQWAAEVGIPQDPVKAALALVSSNVRKVDVAHVDVTSLTILPQEQKDQQRSIVGTQDIKVDAEERKPSSRERQHFLMMAGLGIDAAIMDKVNKNLKHKIGVAAVGITTTQKLPEQRAFPVEIRVMENGKDTEQVWKGEALQIVIGNTRRYANTVEMTADASVDDGMLDACVITAGDPLTTIQQIASLLFRRKPDKTTTEFFRGARLSICIPASIKLQLDGSTVKLKDFLVNSERKALQNVGDMEQVRVAYEFDAIPRTLNASIPRTYSGPLFENEHHEDASPSMQDDSQNASSQESAISPTDMPQTSDDQLNTLVEHGRKVTVIGVTALSDKKQSYIVAGTTSKKSTGETIPVAIRVNENTTLLKQTGEPATSFEVEHLQENTEIVVKGKKSKRGVIPATHLVV